MTTPDYEIRAFVALELPQAVKFFLKELSAELKIAGADVRWVRQEGIHLTLKFLGNVKVGVIPELETSLAAVFSGHPVIEVQVHGVGAFPNLLCPRVVWAGLNDLGQALEPLARRVDQALVSLGFKREKRTFNPHLTLGRVRSKKGISSLVEAVRQRMELAGPAFTADHAVLFQSTLKPTGAEYTALRNFDFSEA